MKKTILTVSLVALLCGCTSQMIEPERQGVNKVDNSASQALAQLQKGEATPTDQLPSLKYVPNSWLPVTKVDAASPAAEAALGRMVVVNRSFSSLSDVSYYLSGLTGIQINIASNVNGGSGSSSTMVPSTPVAPLSPPAFPTGTSVLSDKSEEVETTSIVYSGNLAGLLDLVTSRYGIYWEWDGGSVNFFKTKSKTFRLAALPGDTSLSSLVSSKSSGAGSSGSGASGSGASGSGSDSSSSKSEMETGVKFEGMSVWNGVKENIQQMLSPVGRLSVTPATGIIAVDDTPVVLDRVGKFVEEQNVALSRQVVINVRVLSVHLTHSKDYGINWDAVYKSVGSEVGVALANPFTGTDSSSKLTVTALTGSPWNGTKAVIDALSQQGHVSQMTSASVITLNNQPAPIQVGRQIGYLASSTTTLDSNGGASSISLTPGQVTTGFSMSVLPHILDNKKLMLQYSGDLSSLNDMGKITSGTSTIQTPDVDVRSFLQRVILNSGEVLVISGFEQFNLSADTKGAGHPENALLGGGISSSNGKDVIVVLVQPVLLNGNK